MKDIVKAEDFQLTDSTGKVRARIYISDEDKIIAEVYDSSGKSCNTIDLQKAISASTAQQSSTPGEKENLSDWHTRIANEVQAAQPKLHVGSYKLYIDFIENNTRASSKYLNEVIEISGEIVDVNSRDFGNLRIGLKGMSNFTAEVICHFTDEQTSLVSNLKPGQKVRVKGKCTELVNKRVKIWGCQII